MLRGFALLGILVVNMSVFKAPLETVTTDAGGVDQLASWLIAFAFEFKFYVLFSFLFGYGLSVQMLRAEARNTSAVPRVLRRLLALLIVGVAHALLLFIGDILVTYALLGLVLLLMRNAPPRALLRRAAALWVLSALLVTGLGALVASAPAEDPAVIAAETRAEAERSERAYSGTPAEVVGERVRQYPLVLTFALLGQGPIVLAMFLVGLWAGRRRVLERIDEHRPFLRRVGLIGLGVGAAGSLVGATVQVRAGIDFLPLLLAIGLIGLTAPGLSAAYMVGITALWRRASSQRWLAHLAPVGRMALTNYLLQSLVGALVFTGYGLGLFGDVGAGAGLVLSFGIFALQVPLSAWWLRRFRFGPVEWLLRSFTYARRQPFRSS